MRDQLISAPKTAPAMRPSLGDRVRQLRIAKGLTQTELAGERFSKEYVSQIERGKTRPTGETIEWLAARLGVDQSFLETGVSSSERERVESVIARAEAALESNSYQDAVDEIGQLGSALDAVAVPALQFRALLAESWGRMNLGEVREAIARLDAALELVERSALPADRLRSNILGWRSRCYRRQRDWEAAREDVERALELAEGLNDRRTVAHHYFQASLIAERTGHWVLARSYAERAKAQYEELADQANVGRLLNNLGGLNFQLGKPQEAIRHLKDAYRVLLEVGTEADAGYVVSSLAQVHLRTGEPKLAEEQARHALELLGERVDVLDEIGNAQLVLGRSLLDQDRLDEADELFKAAEGGLEPPPPVRPPAAAGG